MLRSRPRRAAICFVAATLVFTEGCYAYHPTALPVPTGSEIRVEGRPLQLYSGAHVRPEPADCHAAQLDGKLFDRRGDTLTLVPVRHMSGYSPRYACFRLTTATLVASPNSTRILARHFSPGRTAGAVVGTAAFLTVIAAVVFVSTWGGANANMQPAP